MTANKTHRRTTHPERTDPIQKTIDYGIDILMLSENLKRTPTERIRRHQIAINTALMLRKAKRI
jgi:hypothetical protein